MAQLLAKLNGRWKQKERREAHFVVFAPGTAGDALECFSHSWRQPRFYACKGSNLRVMWMWICPPGGTLHL